jgi:hypothetical protein
MHGDRDRKVADCQLFASGLQRPLSWQQHLAASLHPGQPHFDFGESILGDAVGNIENAYCN